MHVDLFTKHASPDLMKALRDDVSFKLTYYFGRNGTINDNTVVGHLDALLQVGRFGGGTFCRKVLCAYSCRGWGGGHGHGQLPCNGYGGVLGRRWATWMRCFRQGVWEFRTSWGNR